ncbi:MAG: ribonuclease E/G [Pseudomonadota bacterium]|nr:ribonuclease E/G [Pseudomonadota bacterium]
MKQGIYIDRGLAETRTAIVERGRVVEIHVARDGDPRLTGAVWLGRVVQTMPELQAASVDTGMAEPGFLRAADARALAGPDAPPKIGIAKLVRRGQVVLVQAGRAADDEKAMRLTADIGLLGRTLALHPLLTGVEAPRRVGDEAQRAELKALVAEASGGMRVVLRPAAARVPHEQVLAELDRLKAEWAEIEAAAQTAKAPALLRPAAGPLARALVELAPPSAELVAAGDQELAADLHGLAKALAPDLLDRITLAPATQGIDLDQTIDAALAPEVALPGGGRLWIEQTRGMVAIDVDGGGAKGTPVDINMRAVPEIAHELRLRRLGGPVVIDFISMRAGNERKRVETALRRAFERDPAMVDVGQVDRFSLASLVRGRQDRSLADELAEPVRATPSWHPDVALERVLRRASAELHGVGPVPVRLTLSSKHAPLLDSAGAARISERFGRQVELVLDSRPLDGFRLERLR